MAGYVKNDSGGYSINYDDQRFKDVQNEKTQQEASIKSNYDNIISNSDKYYQDQINATKEYEKKQSELQQAQTDFSIEQINQQKEQTQKDYTREQQASYVDYMKQTKSNAQNMANSGLSNTGYSESSIVSMYNQYQSRVGTARETLNQSILNYNNSIQQATLANNEKLAEIAYNALQTQNQLNQQAFEYKNNVILEREKALQEVNNIYYQRYLDVVDQINSEIQLQMEIDRITREYEQTMAELRLRQQENNIKIAQLQQQQTQMQIERQQWEREMALKEKQAYADIAYTKAKTAELSNPYTDSSQSESTLSQKGSEIYKSALGIYNSTIAKKDLSGFGNRSAYVASYLNDRYKRGEISAAELRTITKKLGID